MASFREQMQELTAKIARSRKERHQAVAEFPKFHEQLRRQVKRDRDEVRRDLQSTARNQARELKTFNSQNQRNVSRMLRDTRSTRLNRSQTSRSRLQRELGKNRQELLRSLQQNHAQRKRVQRSVARQSQQAIQSVQSRVETLRTATRRQVRALGSDRMEGRRLWAGLRNLSRPVVSEPRRAETATRLAVPVVAPAVSLGTLSGLAMPPVNG